MKADLFTVHVDQDEAGMFIGTIRSIPSCHSEGETQAAMLKNLSEVLELCLRNLNLPRPKSPFAAIVHKEQNLYVAESPEFGTASQGVTEEEALQNLQEATELYLAEFPAQ